MGLSLRQEHLKRYRDVIRLLIKHDRSQILHSEGDAESDPGESAVLERGKGDPDGLASDLESMGPTFIKLGQLLSTRPDLINQPYIEALRRLQDRVEPFPFEQVEEIVSRELGVRLSKAFESFDPKPLAAASLAQVHRARLRDGREVAVKVQRPAIRERVVEDLDAFDEIAGYLDGHTQVGQRYALKDLFDSFRKSLIAELDLLVEARNLSTMRENLKAYERIVVPAPIPDYSSARVLTMEFISGTKVTDLSPVVRLELDGRSLAEDLVKAYLDQVLVHGFFHADPHPGNILVTRDHRLALLDLGMIARIGSHTRETMLKLVLATTESDAEEVVDLMAELGTPLDEYDRTGFSRAVSDLLLRYEGAALEEIELGRTILESARIAGRYALRPPAELTMLGKTLLNLDEITRTLDSDFQPNRVMREHSDSLMSHHMLQNLSPGKLFASMIEVNELVRTMPSRVNTLLEDLVQHRFEIKINALDEANFLSHLQKIANRIAMGIVLGALTIGAALMMRVETDLTLLGYPAIAMVLFLLAAACGFGLVVDIFMNDRWPRRK